MKNIFVLSIVTLITFITSKKCTLSWVDANPAFTNSRQCYNATALVPTETQKLTFKVEVAPCEDRDHNCAVPETDDQITANQPAFCENYQIKKQRVAGEKCNHDLECYSQDCISGTCRGRSYNQTCDGNEECDVGLACRTKQYPADTEHKPINVCVPQIANNHTFCENDYHCTNERGCNGGVCVDYFSLSNFEQSSSPNYCKSNFVDNGRCLDITLIPEDKKTTANFECLDDTQECIYQIAGRPAYDPKKPDENNIVRRKCQCSRAAESKSYCPADTLGAKGQAILTETKKALVKGVHTVRRVDETKVGKDYYFPKFEQATDNVYLTHVIDDASTSSAIMKISIIGLLLIFGL